ncbi:MAG TPA: hypothetical protein VE685_05045 [Thermoanaerobaculia bacterium]|nr:hypothetical protein [Thermoanaerobaculia bacterium]
MTHNVDAMGHSRSDLPLILHWVLHDSDVLRHLLLARPQNTSTMLECQWCLTQNKPVVRHLYVKLLQKQADLFRGAPDGEERRTSMMQSGPGPRAPFRCRSALNAAMPHTRKNLEGE